MDKMDLHYLHADLEMDTGSKGQEEDSSKDSRCFPTEPPKELGSLLRPDVNR